MDQMILEVFKSLKKTNPKYVQDLLKIKASTYNMRSAIILEQPEKLGTTFGLPWPLDISQ